MIIMIIIRILFYIIILLLLVLISALNYCFGNDYPVVLFTLFFRL